MGGNKGGQRTKPLLEEGAEVARGGGREEKKEEEEEEKGVCCGPAGAATAHII